MSINTNTNQESVVPNILILPFVKCPSSHCQNKANRFLNMSVHLAMYTANIVFFLLITNITARKLPFAITDLNLKLLTLVPSFLYFIATNKGLDTLLY